MDALDLFFKKYSYKFDKGYPDISDPKDKRLLFELIGNIQISKLANQRAIEYYSEFNSKPYIIPRH